VRIGGGKKKEEREWYNEGTRTNMFLPVEVSEDGHVGFVSSTISFNGSLSPSVTWRMARVSTICAWTITVSDETIFVFSGQVWFRHDLSAVLIDGSQGEQ
jgi:hypothetical protein